MIIKKFKQNKGYTLVETMVAVALFLVVVMSGLGALLNVNLVHHKSKDMFSIMDNLSFILEDMSRNLRTGYNYRCYDSTQVFDISDNPNYSTPRSCENGGVLVFEATSGGYDNPADQWVYKVTSSDGERFNISKSVDGGATFVQLNIDEIKLKSGSGFSVLGAEPPPGDSQQPLVILRLIGEMQYRDIITPFALQTSVSQRLIDIGS